MAEAAAFPWRPAASTLLTLAVSACAPGFAPAVPLLPDPWTEDEIRQVADLIALEDTRVFTPAIADAAISPSTVVQRQGALTAGRIDAPESRPIVRLLLADIDTGVVATAAFFAGHLRDSTTVSILGDLLADTEAATTVRSEAAAALGKIGTPDARQYLHTFLEQADPVITSGEILEESLIGAWRAGEPSVTSITRWLSSPNSGVRWRAAYALARMARPELVGQLRPLLADPDPIVLGAALRGLTAPLTAAAGVDRGEILGEILSVAGVAPYPARIEAIRVLGTYPDAQSVDALLTHLGSAAPHVVAAAVEALGRLGPDAGPAAEPFARLLASPNTPSHIRALLVSALDVIRPASLESLTATLVSDPDWRVRSALATAIAARRLDAVDPLTALARDRDPRVAASTLSAIVEAFDPASLATVRTLLLEMLNSPDTHVRAAAAEGLSILVDPSTFPALLDAYDRAQRDIQNDAAIAAIDAISAMRAADLVPERAFFARFARHGDHRVRMRAIERFGDAARLAWGDARPIDTGRTTSYYIDLVANRVSRPPVAGARPSFAIETNLGVVLIELFADDAPLTAANFGQLAAAGYFDGQQWARVVPNFVVQGGDPRGDTSGGPGYSIRDEPNRHRFDSGTVGMALSGPDTGGSQFFITHAPQPHLDGIYTVFGRVLSGQDVIERLLPGDRIVSVREVGELECCAL
jgi:cyclophilin family peptidyl-prolyl cis-trans isomerase/HEAT repeat protein